MYSFFLYDLLEELKGVLGDIESVSSIMKVRVRSGREHLRKELGDIFWRAWGRGAEFIGGISD